MNSRPAILYSFRRCPYAMRARLAIQSSGIKVQLREIDLSNKAPELLASSTKGTVPILVTQNKVIEHSFEIMCWALGKADPERWLKMPDAGYDWISRNDGPFKIALDHTKYSVRYPDLNIYLERERAAEFLYDLNTQLADNPWLFGKCCSLADIAILPFVRQFANIDKDWFYAQSWKSVNYWLTRFSNSNNFKAIMTKYDKWSPNSSLVSFPK